MRHGQYIVKIPVKTLRQALNLADHIKFIMPVSHQNEKDNIVFEVTSDKQLKTIPGKLFTTTTIDQITEKKKPGRPPKKETGAKPE